MNRNEIIDSYVVDVARRLPVRKRGDVALELRSLLDEELQEKDEAATVEFLNGFGTPAEVAARYNPQATAIVAPEDTRSFVVASVAGLSILGLSPQAGGQVDGKDLHGVWWLGVLVLVFATKGWAERRWGPWRPTWTPRAQPDRTQVHVLGNVALIVLTLAALVVYCAPVSTVQLVLGDRFDAGSLAYTDDFRDALRMPWLIGLLGLYALLHMAAIARGRWSPAMRWIDIVLVLHIGLQLGWHAQYDHIFVSAAVENAAKPYLLGLNALLVLTAGVKAWREWSYVDLRVEPGRLAARGSLEAAAR